MSDKPHAKHFFGLSIVIVVFDAALLMSILWQTVVDQYEAFIFTAMLSVLLWGIVALLLCVNVIIAISTKRKVALVFTVVNILLLPTLFHYVNVGGFKGTTNVVFSQSPVVSEESFPDQTSPSISSPRIVETATEVPSSDAIDSGTK